MADPLAPLRIALVGPPDWRIDDWQANIITRLDADPRFVLIGRLSGTELCKDPRPAWPVRAVLALEQWAIMARRPKRPTDKAARILAALPAAQDQGADLALVLDDLRLDAAQLADLRLGEVALSVAGSQPGSDWLRMTPESRGTALIGVTITRRTASDPLPRTIASTGYSPKLTSVATSRFVAEKSGLFLLKTLAALARDTNVKALDPPPPPDRLPGTRDLPGYLCAVAARTARRIDTRLRERVGRGKDYWALSLCSGTLTEFEPARGIPLDRPSAIMADPFLFADDGALYVFYEAQRADNQPAWIDAARIEDDRLVPLGTALKVDYHLSFPFVFRHGDDIFMMPETQSTKRIEIWKATGFPLEWELHATGLEGLYPADSTLFQHEGTWFLFTNLSDHVQFQEHSSELYIYTCDGPSLRDLRPHPQNPVVIGSDVARNAGGIMAEGGRLFRPSQNNSFGVYGYGLNLMEIETLTPERYSERLYRAFTPEDLPGVRALHHVSCAEGRCVYDWSAR